MCTCVWESGRLHFSHVELAFKLGEILGKLKEKIAEQINSKIVLFLVEPRNRHSESRTLGLGLRQREIKARERERERDLCYFI